MNNQKEAECGRKPRISKGKVVAGAASLAVVLSLGAYLSFSESARGFLRQSGAIAIKSFQDVFAPGATDTIVSEINLASFGMPDAMDGELSETSSDVSSAPAKKGRTAVATATTVENRNASGTDLTSVASCTMPQTVSSGSLSIAEDSLRDMSNVTDAIYASDISNATNTVNCPFPASAPTVVLRRVILNEVAWMGSPAAAGETADHSADREWMELKNISGARISLDGWRIMDAGGKVKILFGAGDDLAPDGLYLLSRGGDSVNGTSADKAYTGILPNSGDKLAVLDAGCGISDFLDALSKWPGGSNVTKQTLERTANLGWQTSATAGGTPRTENSAGVPVAIAVGSSTEKYEVSVVIAGDGGGSVAIKPGATVCKTACANAYAAGTAVTLVASPGAGANFVGWSGGCSGVLTCSFVIGGQVSVVADFRSNTNGLSIVSDTEGVSGANNSILENIGSSGSADIASSNSSETSSTIDEISANNSSSSSDGADMASSSSLSSVAENGSSAPTTTPPSATSTVNHLVIAAIQIGGAASNNDFVKIYNSTANAVDIGGFKLRKKSSTGADSSLREFPAGSTVSAGAYFVWANSADGFAETIHADASSTATLAANNSVALFDGNGTQIDAVAWGSGTNQYVEGAPYPVSPTANQVLLRKFADGAVIDTDNNNNNFTL